MLLVKTSLDQTTLDETLSHFLSKWLFRKTPLLDASCHVGSEATLFMTVMIQLKRVPESRVARWHIFKPKNPNLGQL
jgi:hypothetical protein